MCHVRSTAEHALAQARDFAPPSACVVQRQWYVATRCGGAPRPREQERSGLPLFALGPRAGLHSHILTPSHPHTLTPSHPHTITPSHPQTHTPSHSRLRQTLNHTPGPCTLDQVDFEGAPCRLLLLLCYPRSLQESDELLPEHRRCGSSSSVLLSSLELSDTQFYEP